MKVGGRHVGVDEICAGVPSCLAPGWRSIGGTATGAGRHPRSGSPSPEEDMSKAWRVVEKGWTARE